MLHKLTDDEKGGRVRLCLEVLEKYDSGRRTSTWDIIRLVSGDETWVYQFDPETSSQSWVWLFPEDPPPEKFRRSRSTGKQMVGLFVTKTGPIATVALEDRGTVTADWYVHQSNVCPKSYMLHVHGVQVRASPVTMIMP